MKLNNRLERKIRRRIKAVKEEAASKYGKKFTYEYNKDYLVGFQFGLEECLAIVEMFNEWEDIFHKKERKKT